MANTLGNLSLSDMPWLGKPADPMGAMQAGQNFAAKRQAMQQSKEMFPLKKEGARADIDYKVQATASAKGAEGRAVEMLPFRMEHMKNTKNIQLHGGSNMRSIQTVSSCSSRNHRA